MADLEQRAKSMVTDTRLDDDALSDVDERTEILSRVNEQNNKGVDNEVSAQRSTASIAFVLSILVFTRSIDYVLYVRLAHHMKEYTWFVATFCIPPTFLILLSPIVVYKIYFTNEITPAMKSVPWQYYTICGLLDMLGNILGVIPAPFVAGPVQVILSQVIIPANMLVAYLYLGMRYKPSHGIGVLLIFAGVTVATASTILQARTEWYWVVMLCLKSLPAAASNVYKEWGLKDLDLDVWYFNFWVGVYQCVLGLLTFPMVFVPVINGRDAGPIEPREFMTYVKHGFECFAGHNPQLSSPSLRPLDCGPTPSVFTVYILFNVAFNVIMLLSFKRASSTVALVASALRVAFSAFGFTIAFISGPAYRKVTSYDIAGLCILFAGLYVYQSAPEKRGAVSRFSVPAVRRSKATSDHL